jgi:hypothetical protein
MAAPADGYWTGEGPLFREENEMALALNRACELGDPLLAVWAAGGAAGRGWTRGLQTALGRALKGSRPEVAEAIAKALAVKEVLLEATRRGALWLAKKAKAEASQADLEYALRNSGIKADESEGSIKATLWLAEEVSRGGEEAGDEAFPGKKKADATWALQWALESAVRVGNGSLALRLVDEAGAKVGYRSGMAYTEAVHWKKWLLAQELWQRMAPEPPSERAKAAKLVAERAWSPERLSWAAAVAGAAEMRRKAEARK